MPDFDGFPIDADWIGELPDHLAAQARELIDGFTTASLWLKGAVERDHDDEVHLQGFLLLGLTNMLAEGSLRIAQIESARAGDVGIRADILEAVQRSMFAGLLLSGIRFGQQHAEAFLEYRPGDFAGLLEDLKKLQGEAGEAGPGGSDQPDE
jgi:hypothetical protein